jgi:hypothetical protein
VLCHITCCLPVSVPHPLTSWHLHQQHHTCMLCAHFRRCPCNAGKGYRDVCSSTNRKRHGKLAQEGQTNTLANIGAKHLAAPSVWIARLQAHCISLQNAHMPAQQRMQLLKDRLPPYTALALTACGFPLTGSCTHTPLQAAVGSMAGLGFRVLTPKPKHAKVCGGFSNNTHQYASRTVHTMSWKNVACDSNALLSV